MKIASVTAHAASIPFELARVTAHEPMRAASVVLVRVRTDQGLEGVGQIHGAPLRDIAEWVHRLGEVVRGMDALAHLAVWQKLFGLTAPRPDGFLARDGLPAPLPRTARAQITAAIAGIDIALWDIKGKAAGLPVWRLLGGENRPVRAYATGGYYRLDGTDTDFAGELERFVAQGYDAVKIKVGGQTLDRDVERVRVARAAIGDATLLLDMTAAYDLDSAIRFAHAVERYDAFWLEEPLHWHLQPADFRRLAAATHIPLAHCERDLHRYTVRDYVTDGAVRYLQFDSTRHGGFTESLRIVTMAEQFSVKVSPHQVPELHAHLCAAYPEASFAVESNGTPDPLWSGMYRARADLRAGRVHLTDAPGFGIEIDWDFIARHAAG